MKEASTDFQVVDLCEIFSVSRTAFYRYLRGESYGLTAKRKKEQTAVKEVFWEHKRRYGSRRIVAALSNRGVKIGRFKARSLMKEQDLKAIQPKSFVPRTTESKHGKRICPNLLLDREPVQKPNEVWVSDITYLPLPDGKWAYLGAWLDLFSRMIVGWKVADNMRDSLICESLTNAISHRNPPVGLIVHSDRGGQYVSFEIKKIVRKFQFKQSMSRADDPYDNAFAESFWGSLKTELLENGQFLSLEDAQTEIFEYIEIYYNRKRLHSALGYKTPVEFENQFYKINSISK